MRRPARRRARDAAQGGVDDAIDEQDLYPLLRDNCYEVLNVLAAVFNVAGAPHVRLYEMYGPNGSVPGDVAALAYACRRPDGRRPEHRRLRRRPPRRVVRPAEETTMPAHPVDRRTAAAPGE